MEIVKLLLILLLAPVALFVVIMSLPLIMILRVLEWIVDRL